MIHAVEGHEAAHPREQALPEPEIAARDADHRGLRLGRVELCRIERRMRPNSTGLEIGRKRDLTGKSLAVSNGHMQEGLSRRVLNDSVQFKSRQFPANQSACAHKDKGEKILHDKSRIA